LGSSRAALEHRQIDQHGRDERHAFAIYGTAKAER
jgi:hypothetical protein